MLATIALVTIAWPANLTTSAAGLSAESTKVGQVCWRDPKSGWYAIKSVDGDFSNVGITITKDRNKVEARGYDVPGFGKDWAQFGGGAVIKSRRFDASTKHNIVVGASLDAVLVQLGKPVSRRTIGKNGATTLIYQRTRAVSREESACLTNTYVFHAGRLTDIVIQRDQFLGCGD